MLIFDYKKKPQRPNHPEVIRNSLNNRKKKKTKNIPEQLALQSE